MFIKALAAQQGCKTLSYGQKWKTGTAGRQYFYLQPL